MLNAKVGDWLLAQRTMKLKRFFHAVKLRLERQSLLQVAIRNQYGQRRWLRERKRRRGKFGFSRVSNLFEDALINAAGHRDVVIRRQRFFGESLRVQLCRQRRITG